MGNGGRFGCFPFLDRCYLGEAFLGEVLFCEALFGDILYGDFGFGDFILLFSLLGETGCFLKLLTCDNDPIFAPISRL